MIDTERIKDGVNIVDVIDSYVKLKKNGQNYSACCPFHTESTPSFTVSENKQFYHCFGCGAHGDAIGFLQEYLGVEFIEAVKILGGDIDINNYKSNIIQTVKRVRLPLNKEPHDIDKMKLFLSGKCEEINGLYFYNRCHVLFTTDIHKNIVSMALIEGKGFEVKHYGKEFLYGSCIVFGDTTKDCHVVLCEDYFDAKKQHLNGVISICYFKPLNIRFIYQDLKSMCKSISCIATSKESEIQAENFNIKLENNECMN